MKQLVLLLGVPVSDQERIGRTLLAQCPEGAWIQTRWCARVGSALEQAHGEIMAKNLLAMSANYLVRDEIGQVFLAFTPEDEPERLLPALLRELETLPTEAQLHAIALEPQSAEVAGQFEGRSLSVIDAATLSTGQLCHAVLTRLEEPPQFNLGRKRQKRRFDSRMLLPLLLPVLLAGLLLGRYLTPQPVVLPLPSVSTTPSTIPPTQPDTATQDTRETEAASEPEAKEVTETTETTEPTQSDSVADYVVNRNSMKFHFPDCPSVEKMKESNREFFTGTRQELLDRGCSPCGSCKP